jgi:multidrug efflux system outer membrane protein
MARTAHALLSSVLFASALAGNARAQAVPPAPGRDGPATSTGAPAPASESTPGALPDIKDPMLEPVPPPPNVLTSWGDVMRLVHQRSTALHIANAQVDQASALHRRALSAALPTLSASATLNHHLLHGTGPDLYAANGPSVRADIPNPDTTLNGALDFRQPLVNFGAWYGIGTANVREGVAKLGAEDVQRQLLATVAQAAVGVVTASRVAESSRVSLSSDLSTRNLTRRRAALGAANAVDVLRADQEVSLVRAQLVTADESLRQAREALGSALGFTGAWGVAEELRVEDLERTASSVCRPVPDLSQRTDIRAAQRNVRAAERDRSAVDYLYVPTLDFVSRVGYTSYERSSANGKPITWTVGGQLVWPLYDGGDRYGQQRFTEAATTIAREELTQKTRDALLQAAQADRGVLVARANLEVSTTTRNIAKESARLSRLAFINGNGTSFDLVDSARRLREAEIDLLIKEFQVFQARLTAFLLRSNCAI